MKTHSIKHALKSLYPGVVPLLFALIFFAIPAMAGPPITEVALDDDARWDVRYDGRIYDPALNQTTFTYTVTVYDDPALSHFTAGFALCDDAFVVVGRSPDEAVSIGLDPTTGVNGIKWDIGLNPGLTQAYSFTLQGNIGEGTVNVAVKAGLFAAIGQRPGPSCDTNPIDETYDLSGVLFMDANSNGIRDADEPAIGNVTVAVYDADGNHVGSTQTNALGEYLFSGLPSGEYTVEASAETPDIPGDFNETLNAYFIASTQTSIGLTLVSDSTGNDFGFALDVVAILDDLDASDPDLDGVILAGAGKTIGFWKHQHQVAIQGKGRAQVDAATLRDYLAAVEGLYLPVPYQFGNVSVMFQTAFGILSIQSSDMVDLLKKQLLGTELNHVSGRGLTDHMELQGLLIAWAEYLVLHQAEYTRDQLEDAKNIMDLINNTGN